MVDWVAWKAAGLVFDTFSGVVLMALGVAVALVRPRTAMGFTFAAFAIMYGLNRTVLNALAIPNIPRNTALVTFYGTTMVVAATALLALTLLFSRRRQARKVWLLIAPLFVLPISTLLLFVFNWSDAQASTVGQPFSFGSGLYNLVAYDLHITALAAFCVAQTLQPRGLDGQLPRQTNLSGAAMGILVGSIAGFTMLSSLEGGIRADMQYTQPGVILAPIYCAVVWLIAAAKHNDRSARNIALVTLLTATVSLVLAALVTPDPETAQDLGFFGLGRIIAVITLAYAIAKHRLFDVDVRIKFGIKQSTVAAIFIAAFFVVSELTASLLSDRIGVVAGVVTTGLLVFAIAPLQQLGERVANRAVPDARAMADRSAAEREAMYQELVAAAWTDGTLSRSENAVLMAAREQLRLTPEQVMSAERSGAKRSAAQ